MQVKALEAKLRQLLIEKYRADNFGTVLLGQSIRTFDQWRKAGFFIKKGEKGLRVKVGEQARFYFWWKQTYNIERWKKWKKEQKANTFTIEPSGHI